MTERLDEGYRDEIATGQLHDASGHEVAVDFPHNVMDAYRTDWAPGCWDDSMKARLPAMCFNHNADMIIGAGRRAESLGHATRVIGQFANLDKVPKAAEVYSLLEDEMIPGWSYHYRDGQSIAHPDIRGARRYVKARMLEFSPVTFPSIPGAVATGLRAEEATTLSIPTVSELRSLRDDGELTEEGYRAALATHYPDLREHIIARTPTLDDKALEGIRAKVAETYGAEAASKLGLSAAKVTTPTEDPERPCKVCGSADHDTKDHADAAGAAVAAKAKVAGMRTALTDMYGEEALRHVVISIGHPGEGAASDGGDEGGGGGDGDEDAGTLAGAVDAALDQCASLVDGTDLTTLPENVQQALALAQAAGVAVDELLEVMGVADPDGGRAEDPDGSRAADDDKPPWAKPCSTCKGDGKIKGNTTKCPDCNGKGWTADPADDPANDPDKDGKRAVLTAEARNALPNEAFGYIEPSAKKDGPKSSENGYHFPLHDKAHVSDALARIAQGAEFGDEAKPKVLAAAKKFGIDAGGKDGKRSIDPEAELAARFARMGTPVAV